jgi:hypothetical protein
MHATGGNAILNARLIGGATYISAGDLGVPLQPVFGVAAGHPFPLHPVTLEVGAAMSYTPLPYQVMSDQRRATLLGAHVVFSASYPIAPKLAGRGELGAGVLSISGLVDGNPLSKSRMAGSFTLPHFRLGLAADYEITPNVIATVAPISVGFAPGSSDMYASSLLDLQFAVAVGYRH